MSKADYVLAQKQSREHACHWPGCEQQVPPAMWGCKAHWFSLPTSLRNRIWAAYTPGQEIRFDPSPEYIAAAEEAQRWISEFQASQRGQGSKPMQRNK